MRGTAAPREMKYLFHYETRTARIVMRRTVLRFRGSPSIGESGYRDASRKGPHERLSARLSRRFLFQGAFATMLSRSLLLFILKSPLSNSS